MRDWLVLVTEQVVVVIDALALVIVVVGTLQAFLAGLRAMLSSSSGTRGARSGCATHDGSWPA
jgi:hypothetical protein